jgi:hypothetical protein
MKHKFRGKKRISKLLLFLMMFIFFNVASVYAADMGDVNDDSSVDIVDALMIAQYYVGLEPAGFDVSVSDVDDSGDVNIVDALLVAQYYVGLISEFPGGTPASTQPPTTTAVPGPTDITIDCSNVPEWEASATYADTGTRVQYNGNVYENNWYSQNQNPEQNSGEYDVWTLIGPCDPSSTATPIPSPTPTPEPAPTVAPGETGVPSTESEIGILWASWDPYHYQDWSNYVNKVDNYNMRWVAIVPTYFIDTYSEGILTSWRGNQKVPDSSTIKSIIKEFLNRGFSINFRPHLDPIKYAMDYGDERDNWSSDPGGKDWRGKFDRLNPTDSGIGYKNTMIMPSLQTLAEVLREMGSTDVKPVRFDIGAELMDSMLNYTQQWIQLQSDVRSALSSQYSDVADKILISYNFCHHIEYLRRLPNHDEYLARIHPHGEIDTESQYLDRPGVTDNTRTLIGQFIAGLDEFTISQYMPLDIYSEGGETTPEQVRDALLYHEQNFINESLIAECGMSAGDIPPLHVGEYGMGIRGLAAPNVWDRGAWERAGVADQLLSDDEQKRHAETAIKGVILYMEDSRTVCNSLLIWLGGKPYDILGLNDYSEGWYNQGAAQALEEYWNSHN